jgi:Tol biopolymer transport system component
MSTKSHHPLIEESGGRGRVKALVFIWILLGLVFAAGVTATGSARAGARIAFSRGDGKIAFVRTVGCIPLRHCWWGLYVMNPDGSGKRRLAPHAWVSNVGVGSLAWSPDRRKLVFAAHLSRSAAPCDSYCGKEIFVINADGSGLRRLTRNTVADWEPAWSPDGQKIAWLSRGPHGTGADVVVMNADGSDQQNLTPKPGHRGEPRWSPDGRAILFTAVPPGQPRSPPGWPYNDVYVMNADGSGQRNLTHTPEAGEFGPAWSPDGQHIAFKRLGPPGEVRIIVMHADGSAKHAATPKLTHTGDGWITVTAAWSPDGGRIAFDYHDVIYVINADGTGLRRLAQNAAFESWSPDGRKLIISRLTGLWVMNADGSGERNLTRDGWGATWAS